MKNETKTGRRGMKLLAGLMGLGLLAGRASAANTNPAVLTIDVTVNAALSVKVDGVGSSTRTATITPGTRYVNTASSVTVLSDATGISEFWKLSSAAAPKADGSTGWSLVTSTNGVGTDEHAVQALFISSNAAAGDCPATGSSAWNALPAAPLTTTPVTYRSSDSGASQRFSDTTVTTGNANGNPDFTGGAGNDGRMRPNNFRGFCFRITPPSDVTFTENVFAHVIVTASLTQ